MTYKMIQVGTGGFGGSWCRRFLPPNVQDGLIEVVAAVDVDPNALENAQEFLGLRQDQCYTDIQRAFHEDPAAFPPSLCPRLSTNWSWTWPWPTVCTSCLKNRSQIRWKRRCTLPTRSSVRG